MAKSRATVCLVGNIMEDIQPENQQENNPFLFFKIREVILLYFVINITIFILNAFLNWSTVTNLLNFIGLLITLIFVLRKCKSLKIDIQRVIGRISSNFSWLLFLLLILFWLLFSYGIQIIISCLFQIIYFQKILLPDIYSDLIIYFDDLFPVFLDILKFFLLSFFMKILWILFTTFTILGIVFHKIAINKGLKKAMIIVSCIYGITYAITFYFGFIENFILGLILCMLYLKTKTLIIPFLLKIGILILYWLSEAFRSSLVETAKINSIGEFDFGLILGTFLVLLSLPYLSYWIYRHWNYNNQQIPYFANQSNIN